MTLFKVISKSENEELFYKKEWLSGSVQIHFGPPPIPPVQISVDKILDKDDITIKLRKKTMSEK